MSKRTLLALLVFAGLAVAAWATLTRKAERNLTRLSFKAVDKAAVDKLEIAGRNPVQATKQGASWVLSCKHEAPTPLVESAIDAATRIDTSDLVTANAARFAELGVDDAAGTKVSLGAGPKTVADFVVGKEGGAGTYVRKGQEVYRVKGISPAAFSRPAAQWHQLKLFPEKLEDVTRVEISVGGAAPYALVKAGEDWRLEDPKLLPQGFRFDARAARDIVAMLVNTSAQQIAEENPAPAATGISATSDLLAFVAKDGSRHELRLGGAAPEDGVWAQLTGRKDLFVLAAASTRQMRRGVLGLRDLSLTKLGKDKVTRLEIADGSSRLVLEKQGADWKVASSTAPVPKDFAPDPAQVDRRLAMLAAARGLALAEPGAQLGKVTADVVASVPEGAVKLTFGTAVQHETAEAFLARGNADGELYVVTKRLRDQLVGGLETFRKVATPPGLQGIDPAQLSNLPPEAREQLMKQLAAQQVGK